MRLYVDREGTAPSPRRVRIFLVEKGLEVELVRLAIHEENRTPEFRDKNPYSTLPVLELDDGTCVAESLAICRYFEALHPDPPLFGDTPLAQARVEMWLRRVELSLYLPIELAGEGILPPESSQRFRRGAYRSMGILDDALADNAFLAGDAYSMADAFALSALDFGVAYNGFAIDPALAHLSRWHRSVSSRPSAAG